MRTSATIFGLLSYLYDKDWWPKPRIRVSETPNEGIWK